MSTATKNQTSEAVEARDRLVTWLRGQSRETKLAAIALNEAIRHTDDGGALLAEFAADAFSGTPFSDAETERVAGLVQGLHETSA